MSAAAPGDTPSAGGGRGDPHPPPHPHPTPHRRRRCPAPPPSLPPGRGTDVFVTSRTDFRAQLRRCQRLLAGVGSGGSPQQPPELRLHGLGLAVPRTINLALQLQAAAPPGTLRLHPSTSSVALTPAHGPRRRGGDGGEAEEGEWEDGGDGGGSPRLRHNSAIHIRVCREAPCA